MRQMDNFEKLIYKHISEYFKNYVYKMDENIKHNIIENIITEYERQIKFFGFRTLTLYDETEELNLYKTICCYIENHPNLYYDVEQLKQTMLNINEDILKKLRG